MSTSIFPETVQKKPVKVNNFLGIFILVSKAWIPMSLNFSLPVHAKFNCINEIKAMYERQLGHS